MKTELNRRMAKVRMVSIQFADKCVRKMASTSGCFINFYQRISVADYNVPIVASGSRDSGNGSRQQDVDNTREKSLASMNEDTLFTMWDLRHPLVRLERIDVEKTLRDLKSKAIATK